MSPYLKYIFIPVHLYGLYALYVLFHEFTWLMLPVIWLGWFFTGCLGSEIGLHRLFSHKAFKLSGKMKWFIGWLACMAGQWSPLFWVSLHRGYHHTKTDTPSDIHSPVNGKFNAFVGWLFHLKETDVKLIYAKDLLRDKMHMFLHQHYTKIFWISLLIIRCIIGMKWTMIGVIIPILLAMHQENLTNLLCHIRIPFSYRNFDTDDKSYNVYPLGLLFWGQGFHNNHHAKPSRYDFGSKLLEFDICKWVVPALVWLDRRIK